MVLLLFFCSGATALVYEVVWSKYLAQMLGSTIQAQTMVLAVFMGGLALGNRLLGPVADRSPRPLELYGRLEVGIGLYAFFFTSIYHFADQIFIGVGRRWSEEPGAILALKTILSVGLLLGPTVLMGGTLPIMAAWLQRGGGDAGRRSARFYSVNSLGAVFGAWMAGFFLIQWIGLTSALQMTALANVLVGIAAVGLGRRVLVRPVTVETTPETVPAGGASPVLRWGGWLVALTGGVSMGLEVLASRSLSLIFGASLQAFAIVLMAFILGIGLGSACVASPRWRGLRREVVAPWLLLGAAGLIGILLSHIEQVAAIYLVVKSGLARSDMGYRFHQIMVGGISVLFLGVPAGLLGAVLPLWIRGEQETGGQTLGTRVGRLLTWNTLGCVVGVLLTGFVIMPGLGLRGAFGFLAGCLCLVAFILSWMHGARRWMMGVAVAVGLFTVVTQMGGEGWRHVMSSGVFRERQVRAGLEKLALRQRLISIDFYEDAPDATVSVEHVMKDTNKIFLRVNGKTDASTRGDMSTQYLLGHLPLMARPESKDVFILGLGSGITAGAVLHHPIERLEVSENCEPVVRAARFFAPWNNGVLTNSRVVIRNEDARTVLKLTSRQYDVIISEPSNPWMAGVGSVFSREFYELAASRLKPGGLMTQWFHIYEMNDGIVALVLRTFASVFPCCEIWDSQDGDVILIGSREPWSTTSEQAASLLARPGARLNLAQIGITSPAHLFARQLASARTAYAIPGEGPIQQDGFPVLEYEAPKAFYIDVTSRFLQFFDERTLQSDFMPPWKRSLLQSLTDADLAQVFQEFGTGNAELARIIRPRIRAATPVSPSATAWDVGFVPCVFRPAEAVPPEPPAEDASAAATMRRAQWLLCHRPEEWRLGVRTFMSGLERWKPGDPQESSDDAVVPGAAAAIRSCLRNGDKPQARLVYEAAIRLAPESMILGYLKRLMESGSEDAVPAPRR